MPAASSDDDKIKTLREVAEATGDYPAEAWEFVQTGLRFTAAKVHGQALPANGQRHVSGQQLCAGLREYALTRYGMMARTVLERWHIRSTSDFGRIVFGLVEAGLLGVTNDDTPEDFRDVFDFSKFDSDYRIQSKL